MLFFSPQNSTARYNMLYICVSKTVELFLFSKEIYDFRFGEKPSYQIEYCPFLGTLKENSALCIANTKNKYI